MNVISLHAVSFSTHINKVMLFCKGGRQSTRMPPLTISIIPTPFASLIINTIGTYGHWKIPTHLMMLGVAKR